jgi:hypothetical protein
MGHAPHFAHYPGRVGYPEQQEMAQAQVKAVIFERHGMGITLYEHCLGTMPNCQGQECRVQIQAKDGSTGFDRQFRQQCTRTTAYIKNTPGMLQPGVFKKITPQILRPAGLLRKTVMPIEWR